MKKLVIIVTIMFVSISCDLFKNEKEFPITGVWLKDDFKDPKSEECSSMKKFIDGQSKDMKKKYGPRIIPKGTFPCMGREAIYTAGMCSLTPIFEERLLTSSIYKKKSMKSSLTASIGSGLVAGAISHPFDTIKTHIQNHPDVNSFKAIRTLLHTEGWNSLLKGSFPRSLRIIGTFFIINECNRFYIKNIFPQF